MYKQIGNEFAPNPSEERNPQWTSFASFYVDLWEVLVIEEVVIEEVVKLLSMYICTYFIFERIILCTFLFGFYAVFTHITKYEILLAMNFIV